VVTFDPAALKARLGELEQELAQPDFWSDQQRAARLSAEHQRTQEKLRRYDELVANVEFLQEGARSSPKAALEWRPLHTHSTGAGHTARANS
jgi:protein subunit release factor A